MAAKERFIIDDQGERVAVVLDINEYNLIVEDLEELDDIRAFDEAEASGEAAIPAEQAFAEIERNRKGNTGCSC